MADLTGKTGGDDARRKEKKEKKRKEKKLGPRVLLQKKKKKKKKKGLNDEVDAREQTDEPSTGDGCHVSRKARTHFLNVMIN